MTASDADVEAVRMALCKIGCSAMRRTGKCVPPLHDCIIKEGMRAMARAAIVADPGRKQTEEK